ncbi:MAG TPA: tryptophan--tRNA ligase [Thermoplasmata archaeon]|nr:tryptophan--tRNA ligase [Thermoplasmata archaeon]
MREEEFSVTPWEVKGKVDYDRLIKEFGTDKIEEGLLTEIKKYTHDLHPLLKRKIFFSHRDLDWILAEYSKGVKFYLYTGRGPSGDVHLGHLVPWIFTKWLQDKFDVELWFQLTDDEKYLFEKKLGIRDAKKFARSNALDIIALGFDPEKTHIFSDIQLSGLLYPQALKVAKRVNFSTTKAIFGFNEQSNIGQIFFTSMQAVPAFLPSALAEKNIPCLIPHAIDQDPHFRLARDVLPKLGYLKPAAIHCKFFPGLKEGGKMSASKREDAIFTTDSKADVKKKISNAFTGGATSIKEQRTKGGNPDKCSIFQYYCYLFEWDDEKLQTIRNECKGGSLLCGECKKRLIERVEKFLEDHQRKREEAKDLLDKYLVEHSKKIFELYDK